MLPAMHDRIVAADDQPKQTTSPEATRLGKPPSGWRRAWFEVIFESQTRAGRTFDLLLLAVIVASVLVVVVDSVSSYSARHESALNALEWTFTALFTAEYLARLVSVQRPWRYATSFYGIVDLMSVLPTYLRMRKFSKSATYMFLRPASKATQYTDPNCALAAWPPSPENPFTPVPANAAILPDLGSRRRMRLFDVSAM